MKYKKLTILFAAFILIFTYYINPYIEDKVLYKKPYKDEIIRFHVRANSDKKEDQELKLDIRDKILELMNEKLSGIKDIEESRYIIENNKENIKNIALNVIKEKGFDYNIDVFLGIDEFPIRRYGNIIFPQGEYETLLVTIGEGRGQNWWCVMFPPLCFVDITHSHALEIDEQHMKLIDENETPKLKSKIGEWIKKKTSKSE